MCLIADEIVGHGPRGEDTYPGVCIYVTLTYCDSRYAGEGNIFFYFWLPEKLAFARKIMAFPNSGGEELLHLW